jgi:hypothetical protein
MGCGCKKPKTPSPTPPSNKVVVKESKEVDNIVNRLNTLLKK